GVVSLRFAVVSSCGRGLCDSYSGVFFQAEDGRRDRDVTGVQTCALPILIIIIFYNLVIFRWCIRIKFKGSCTGRWFFPLFIIFRSEERRVGKECRPGMSGHQAVGMGE